MFQVFVCLEKGLTLFRYKGQQVNCKRNFTYGLKFPLGQKNFRVQCANQVAHSHLTYRAEFNKYAANTPHVTRIVPPKTCKERICMSTCIKHLNQDRLPRLNWDDMNKTYIPGHASSKLMFTQFNGRSLHI